MNQFAHNFPQASLSENSWTFEDPTITKIKQKVEEQGIPLKEWDVDIFRGVLTGYNEAFIIDSNKRNEIIRSDPNSEKIIKRLLRGKDIEKYYPNYANLWLIATFPSLKYDINDYPGIRDYLRGFGNRIEQTGMSGARKKTSNQWFETQDNIAYWENFEKPKIIYPNMTKYLPFMYDSEGYYTNQKCFILTGIRLAYLTSFFNSKLFKFCFRDNFPELLGGTRELSKVFFELISVKTISEEEEKPFERIISNILDKKKENCNADITEFEAEIDKMIYKFYDLTSEEIKTIEEFFPHRD